MADLVPKKRQAITDLERRNIRRRRDTTGESQKELIAWFAAQPSGRPFTQGMAEREALRVQISAIPGIQDPLSVDEFIEPLAEEVVDEDSDIIEAIYGRDENEDEEEVEGEPEEPPPLLSDAIEALMTLQRFEMPRDDDDDDDDDDDIDFRLFGPPEGY